MQKLFRSLILAGVLFVSTSCLKQTESITPIARPQTLAELQREAMMATALLAGNSELSKDSRATVEAAKNDPGIFYLTLKYNVKDLDVFETADINNNFEKLGNGVLKTLASLLLKIKGPQEIEVDPIELDLPNMNLDNELIKSIKIKKASIAFNKEFDQSVKNKASFSFVNSLTLSRIGRNKSQILNYKKSNNLCKFKCIDFTIVNGDIFDLVKNNSHTVLLKPNLAISSLPKVSELRIDGNVELVIGLRLPF